MYRSRSTSPTLPTSATIHHLSEAARPPSTGNSADLDRFVKRLNEDGDTLHDFLRAHGALKPIHVVHISGSHAERRIRNMRTSGIPRPTSVASCTVPVSDFNFSIDLSSLVIPEATFWCVGNDEPVLRGNEEVQIEPTGPVSIGRRTSVGSQEAVDQEIWRKTRLDLGIPPWVNPPLSKEQGRQGKGLPTRPLRDWCHDYCNSKKAFKDFRFHKIVYGWDYSILRTAIENIIRSTGYTGNVSITFSTTPTCIRVHSLNPVHRLMMSRMAVILLCVTLTYPLLWLWKQFNARSGGRWQVAGSAFALQRWDLAPGTNPQESIEECGKRLCIDHDRLQIGNGGVWMLSGTRENEWVSRWESRIRMAVETREHEENILNQSRDSKEAR